ncbi:unnamed protein product [Amoebophrya sp. A25]|nr:unnamed protein product [Amoebophrya sp. A25]|eukprot:GSA25T00010839001.1
MLPTNTQQDVLDLSQGRGGPRSSWTMTSLMVIGLLGTAMAGYDTAVVSGTIDFMAESLKFPRKDDTFQRTAVVASTTICAMLSACAQVLSTTGQSFGRRPVLCAGILLHFVGTTMCVFATEYWFLIAGRSVVGLGAGFIFVVLPMYLGECSAASSRVCRGEFGPLYRPRASCGGDSECILTGTSAR